LRQALPTLQANVLGRRLGVLRRAGAVGAFRVLELKCTSGGRLWQVLEQSDGE
jgi:hypothetical protein